MNLKDAKRFSVDGKDYLTEPLKGRKAGKLALELGRLIGKPLAEMAKASKSANKQQAIMDILPNVAEMLFQNMDSDKTMDLILELLSQTAEAESLQNVKDKYDELFAGNVMLSFKILKEVININFSDFLSVVTFGKTGDQGHSEQAQTKA